MIKNICGWDILQYIGIDNRTEGSPAKQIKY